MMTVPSMVPVPLVAPAIPAMVSMMVMKAWCGVVMKAVTSASAVPGGAQER
jgi:hypothetical protein